MIGKNTIAKGAMVAAFVLGVVSSMVAQPTVPESGDPGGQQAAKGPEQDPNLPPRQTSPTAPPMKWDAPVNWNGWGEANIKVSFDNYPGYLGVYFGFNEKGSWILNPKDRKIYIWNLPNRTLVVGAENAEKLTADELFSLRNSSFAAGKLQSWQSRPVADPNFPYLPEFRPGYSVSAPFPGSPISWNIGRSGIAVYFDDPRVRGNYTVGDYIVSGNYIGYNDRGSWIQNTSDQKVYIWNLQSRTLVVGADNWKTIPTDVLLSMRNSPVAERELAAKGIKTSSEAARNALERSKPGAKSSGAKKYQSANRGPEPDPNLPDVPNSSRYTMPEAPIIWSRPRGDLDISFGDRYGSSSGGRYLGFNEKGSWIENDNNGMVYVWNLQSRTLVVGAEDWKTIPTDVLLSLRNSQVEGMLEERGIKIHTEAANSAVPAGQGDSAPAAPAMPTLPAVGPSGQMHGTGARIVAGVLTFTVSDANSPDNGKQLKYKVTRSANPMMMNPNAPKPADPSDITGQWIGEDPKDKDAVILFFVQGKTGAVAMQEFSGMAAAVMKRMAAIAPGQ